MCCGYARSTSPPGRDKIVNRRIGTRAALESVSHLVDPVLRLVYAIEMLDILVAPSEMDFVQSQHEIEVERGRLQPPKQFLLITSPAVEANGQRSGNEACLICSLDVARNGLGEGMRAVVFQPPVSTNIRGGHGRQLAHRAI